jgi:uncharacterized membrane protein YphA (DoxX/SURF4 family)
MGELHFIGRLLLALYICAGAYNNTTGFAPTVEMMRTLKLPAPALLLRLVIAFEIVAAICLFVPPLASYAALLLAVFCMVAPTLFHPFWTMPQSFERFLHQNLFLANIAVGGAMFLLVA